MTPVNWTCPLCGEKHKWMWPDEVEPHMNDMMWLPCGFCKREYRLTLTPKGWLWDGDWRKIEKHI